MNKTAHNLQYQGFTLIELSIVLVIIGLIIGGILTGQDLINTATVRAQLSQIEKYNTAVNTFRGKYGYLPGDIPNPYATNFGFLSRAGARGQGDGNGMIEGYDYEYSRFDGGLDQSGEPMLFWEDLSQAGLIDASLSTFTNTFNGTSTPTLYFPVSKLDINEYVFAGNYSGNNVFYVEGVTTASGAGTLLIGNAGDSFGKPVMKVLFAALIDQKVDDGMATTGNVLADYVAKSNMVTPTNAPNANPDTSATCYNSATSSYSRSIGQGGGLNCGLLIRAQF